MSTCESWMSMIRARRSDPARSARSSSRLRSSWKATGRMRRRPRKCCVGVGSIPATWGREVEEVIATHPAVAEVGVAGVPDPHSGEAVMAWVVPRKGMGVTEEEVRDHCRRHLAAYKVPKRVEFREALPKSAIGKLLRRELAREFRAAHGPA